MNLSMFNGRLSPFALAAAKLCARAYHPSQIDGLAAAMELFVGAAPAVTVSPIVSGVPALISATGPEGLCIAISGITSVYQALGIETAYGNATLNSSTNWFNEWFWGAAVQLERRLDFSGKSRNRDVFIFGHSGGGGIALALATILRPVSAHNDVHVVTFGSPRACSEQAFRLLGNVNITRWMNTGDDAVRMPPRILDLTDVTFLTYVASIPYWLRFVHVFGGLVLDSAGNVSPGDVPAPQGLLSFATLPSRYLRDSEIFGPAHSLGEYVRRLSLRLPPKIPGVGLKEFPLYDVGSLPIMF